MVRSVNTPEGEEVGSEGDLSLTESEKFEHNFIVLVDDNWYQVQGYDTLLTKFFET